MRILFFAKDRPQSFKALEFLKQCPCTCEPFMGKYGDRFPSLSSTPFDIVISYMSPWLIPVEVLRAATKFTLNFHPGPPEYPGTGCTNFALYNREVTYGVTAHEMEEKVDTGKIAAITRFPILATDSVLDLTIRSHDHLLELFQRVMNYFFANGSLPSCNEKWTRKPYTRAELNALCEVTTQMSDDEILRRVRATYFPNMPGPYLMLAGKKFKYCAD